MSDRDDGAINRIRELTGGFGVHSVLECVGSEEAMKTALGVVRSGGAIGRVGVPHYGTMDLSKAIFYQNVIVAGGPASVQAHMGELLPDVRRDELSLAASLTARSGSTRFPTATAP